MWLLLAFSFINLMLGMHAGVTTPLGMFNFFLAQWVFIRRTSHGTWLGPVLPLTGWWGWYFPKAPREWGGPRCQECGVKLDVDEGDFLFRDLKLDTIEEFEKTCTSCEVWRNDA